MTDVVNNLIRLLELESIGAGRFRGHSQDLGYAKLFGGQVIGQSLSAASQSTEGRLPHSLHAYFIRPGDANYPIDFEVELKKFKAEFGEYVNKQDLLSFL